MATRPRKVRKGKAPGRPSSRPKHSRPPVARGKNRGDAAILPDSSPTDERSGFKSPPSGSDLQSKPASKRPKCGCSNRGEVCDACQGVALPFGGADVTIAPDGSATPTRALIDAIDQSHSMVEGSTMLHADRDLELLTTRRRRFVEEFEICGNQTKAAELAGFSANRAAVEGCELMKDPIIAGIIARREADLFKRLGITQERIFTERAAIALADLGEVFEQNAAGLPAMRPFAEWSPAIRKSIKSIKVKRTDPKFTEMSFTPGFDIIELTLWDKPAQLEKVEARLEADKKRGESAEQLTEKQRIRKISEILSRGIAARDALKKPKK